MRKPRDWQTWEGGYEDLVEAARELLLLTYDSASAPGEEREAYERAHQINERLVRMYVQEGAVGSGERRGREVLFHFEQLLQLVTARHLIAVEGWKIGQVADFMKADGGADVADMQAVLPSRLAEELFGSAPPAAQEYVRSFRPDSAPPTARRAAGATDAQRTSMRFLVRRAEERSDFRRQVEHLRTSSEPPKGEAWLRFRLTPWTEVHIQEVALAAWTDDLVDSLADKLKDLLRAELARRAKRR